MDIGFVRSRLENLAGSMGRELPAIEPIRIPYNQDCEQEAEIQIQRMQDSFKLFKAMDNQTFNGHKDLDETQFKVKHQYGGPSWTADYSMSPSGTDLKSVETKEFRAVIAQMTEHVGNEWTSYSLIDHSGLLTADIVHVVDGIPTNCECEQWYFSGPEMRFAT